jgi:LacI family gluconate utilization system Gnt-I transcriptional repressor
VSEKTRRRILRAINEAGYVHNMIAGSLASERTKVIAAIVPTLTNLTYGRTVHAVGEVLRANGFHLLLGTNGFSVTEEESLVTTFLGRRPDGMFLYGCRHTPEARHLLRNAGIPIVETGNLASRPLDMVVSYSNFEAAKAMTEYLLTKGYRRIAFVSALVRENERHFHRWRGYRAAIHEHGIDYNPDWVIQKPFSLHHGAQAIYTLLDRDPTIEAVFLASDMLAVGAHCECLRRAWPIPSKVAIVGFDDQEIAGQLVPSLTTVRVPREEIGHLAGQMLIDRLQGRQVKSRVVDVGFQIIERASA